MGFAVRWVEEPPFGPIFEVLAYVEDGEEVTRTRDSPRQR